jgi:hypothetical protein
MPSRKGKYNEPYHDGLYRFQDQMFITLGGGPSKSSKQSRRKNSESDESAMRKREKKNATKTEKDDS